MSPLCLWSVLSVEHTALIIEHLKCTLQTPMCSKVPGIFRDGLRYIIHMLLSNGYNWTSPPLGQDPTGVWKAWRFVLLSAHALNAELRCLVFLSWRKYKRSRQGHREHVVFSNNRKFEKSRFHGNSVKRAGCSAWIERTGGRKEPNCGRT